MQEILEKFFPIIATGEAPPVEKTWNLYDIMNFMEFCALSAVKTCLVTFFSIITEIIKFCILLLLTYAFALSIFNFLDGIIPESERRPAAPTFKRPSQFGSRQSSVRSDRNYSSKTGDETPKSPILPNMLSGIESDSLLDEVVKLGSFKRPSDVDENKSTIGKAIEDLVLSESFPRGTNESKRISASKIETPQSRRSSVSNAEKPQSRRGSNAEPSPSRRGSLLAEQEAQIIEAKRSST